MPRLTKKTEKNVVQAKRSIPVAQPVIVAERYQTMLVQVCGYRIILQELLKYLKGKEPGLVEDLEMCLGTEDILEQKMAEAAKRAHPQIKLPRICVHAGEE